jgi:hypothetical protein
MVSFDNLTERLRDRIAADPKRAALWGFAAGVALCLGFWLVRDWVSEAQAVDAPAKSDVHRAPAPSGPADRPSWQEVVEGMRSDPRTTLAAPLGKTRDPFQPGNAKRR